MNVVDHKKSKYAQRQIVVDRKKSKYAQRQIVVDRKKSKYAQRQIVVDRIRAISGQLHSVVDRKIKNKINDIGREEDKGRLPVVRRGAKPRQDLI